MTLTARSPTGSHEILATPGAGGMGEVYHAGVIRKILGCLGLPSSASPIARAILGCE
jgi:hypothetical protein